MEYASGGELFERICKNVRFSEDEVCHSSSVHLCFLIHLVLNFTDYICNYASCIFLGSLLFPAAYLRSKLLPFDGTSFFE
jgi:hypothetical protein